MKITSLTNSKIKNVVQLRSRRQRNQGGLTIVEGILELKRVLDANIEIESIFVGFPKEENKKLSAFLEKLKSLKYPICEVNNSVYSKISYGQKTSGILALCRPPCLTLESLFKKRNPLYVVVDQVEKPGNFGAILRTCDAAGVDAVIVCDERTDLYNPNVIRASLGAVFTTPVVCAGSKDTIGFLEKNNINIYAATPTASKMYTQVSMREGTALVLGSEQEGLGPHWFELATSCIKIPMKGRVDSLNVSSSAAILIYEAIRQKK